MRVQQQNINVNNVRLCHLYGMADKSIVSPRSTTCSTAKRGAVPAGGGAIGG